MEIVKKFENLRYANAAAAELQLKLAKDWYNVLWLSEKQEKSLPRKVTLCVQRGKWEKNFTKMANSVNCSLDDIDLNALKVNTKSHKIFASESLNACASAGYPKNPKNMDLMTKTRCGYQESMYKVLFRFHSITIGIHLLIKFCVSCQWEAQFSSSFIIKSIHRKKEKKIDEMKDRGYAHKEHDWYVIADLLQEIDNRVDRQAKKKSF